MVEIGHTFSLFLFSHGLRVVQRTSDHDWFLVLVIDDGDDIAFFYVLIDFGDARTHQIRSTAQEFDGAHIDSYGFKKISCRCREQVFEGGNRDVIHHHESDLAIDGDEGVIALRYLDEVFFAELRYCISFLQLGIEVFDVRFIERA